MLFSFGSLLGNSWNCLPKRLIELVEEDAAAIEARVVAGVCENQADQKLLDAGGLGPVELRILQVDVVNDLRDLREGAVCRPDPGEQRLEGTPIALVREIASDHVESQLAGAARLFRIDEAEARLRGD